MNVRTTAAFDKYRAQYGPMRKPVESRINHPDDCAQLNSTNGLKELEDGPVAHGVPVPTSSVCPLDFSMDMPDKHIWAVRAADVVYALENCPFGKTLDAGSIKHTNLTGGSSAFVGGELRFLMEGVIVVNGCSGRYPVRDDHEMRALGRAFLDSGHHVWCMGYDPEAGLSYPLGSVESEWLG